MGTTQYYDKISLGQTSQSETDRLLVDITEISTSYCSRFSTRTMHTESKRYIHKAIDYTEEQAPKPVGWMMCFLLMTLVPVQKLCVNIYICVHIPYTSSVIGCIYNGSVIQYWRSCTPSCSIGECAVPSLNAILCFLWFTNCVLLFDNLILGCLWHWVFV